MEHTFNIKDFVIFLRKMNNLDPIRIYFNDVIHFYEQSLGGCGCNRKAREDRSEIVFVEKINTCPSDYIKGIKEYLNVEKIFFVRRDNFIFKNL